MPTLECLDERSELILKRIDELGRTLEARDMRFEEKLLNIEQRVGALEIKEATEAGRRSVLLAIGGGVFFLLGTIANMLWSLFTGTSPHGPFK